LAGLKPTEGLIGRTPIPSWMDMSTSGPLAVSIADVALLLDVMKGPAAGDPTSPSDWTPRPGARPGRVFATPRMVEYGPLPDGIHASFDLALQGFVEATGLDIEPITPADIWKTAPAGSNPDEDWVTIACVEELVFLGREFVEREMDNFAANFANAMRFAMQ